jgi:hypothetical protein
MKNPQDPWKYRWSSHRAYLGGEGPINVHTSGVLQQFASKRSAARKGYLDFMKEGRDQGVIKRDVAD